MTELSNVIPHDELNSLVTLVHDDEYNLSIGISDVLKQGEPRFSLYNNRLACDATKSIEVSMVRPKVFDWNAKPDMRLCSMWALACTQEMVSRFYPVHNYSVWQMLLFVWNLLIGAIQPDLDGKDEEGWNCLEAFVGGKYDTPENLGDPRYLPSIWKQPNFTEANLFDV